MASRARRPNYSLTRARRRRRYRLRRGLAIVVLLLVVAAAVVLILRHFATNKHGAREIDFTIKSPLVHQTLPAVAVVPAGTSRAGRPLLVFLHAQGDNQNSYLNSQMFAALAAQGSAAPDVVFPYGSDSWWHNRSTGAWASYVFSEVIPQAVALLHADGRRVAIGGISMGAFGALDIARLHPDRFCAVGAHSAALFLTDADAPSGAFDDRADSARNNVIRFASRSNLYGKMPVWIDVGKQDSYLPANMELMHELRAHGANVTFSVEPGGHNGSYWNSRWSDYMSFYSRSLASCP
jgi:enterochelin esterase-like enzyme